MEDVKWLNQACVKVVCSERKSQHHTCLYYATKPNAKTDRCMHMGYFGGECYCDEARSDVLADASFREWQRREAAMAGAIIAQVDGKKKEKGNGDK